MPLLIPWREEEAEHVHHLPHLLLALAHPHRLVGVPGDAALVAAGRAGPDEGSRVAGQLRHQFSTEYWLVTSQVSQR